MGAEKLAHEGLGVLIRILALSSLLKGSGLGTSMRFNLSLCCFLPIAGKKGNLLYVANICWPQYPSLQNEVSFTLMSR